MIINSIRPQISLGVANRVGGQLVSTRLYSSSASEGGENGQGRLTKLESLRLQLKDSDLNLQHFMARSTNLTKAKTQRVPPWIKVRPPDKDYFSMKKGLKGLKLATVCQEAKCPNISECWSGEEGTATATIMIMGDTCTRGCRFCSVKTSRTPPPLDPLEAERTAEAVADFGVDYIVITMVNRDDIEDGGASHFAKTVEAVKMKSPNILIECLTGDFRGKLQSVEMMANSPLDVFAHNIETVEELQRWVRDYRANYKQSLLVLEHAKLVRPSLVTKSSLMLGHGETSDQIRRAMKDLLSVGVDCLTLGQYLQPTKHHLKVERFLPLEEWDYWKEEGEKLGFKYVASGPLVRSSYKAGEFYIKNILDRGQTNIAPIINNDRTPQGTQEEISLTNSK